MAFGRSFLRRPCIECDGLTSCSPWKAGGGNRAVRHHDVLAKTETVRLLERQTHRASIGQVAYLYESRIGIHQDPDGHLLKPRPDGINGGHVQNDVRR